jgi:hypothetical protein
VPYPECEGKGWECFACRGKPKPVRRYVDLPMHDRPDYAKREANDPDSNVKYLARQLIDCNAVGMIKTSRPFTTRARFEGKPKAWYYYHCRLVITNERGLRFEFTSNQETKEAAEKSVVDEASKAIQWPKHILSKRS